MKQLFAFSVLFLFGVASCSAWGHDGTLSRGEWGRRNSEPISIMANKPVGEDAQALVTEQEITPEKAPIVENGTQIPQTNGQVWESAPINGNGSTWEAAPAWGNNTGWGSACAPATYEPQACAPVACAPACAPVACAPACPPQECQVNCCQPRHRHCCKIRRCCRRIFRHHRCCVRTSYAPACAAPAAWDGCNDPVYNNGYGNGYGYSNGYGNGYSNGYGNGYSYGSGYGYGQSTILGAPNTNCGCIR